MSRFTESQAFREATVLFGGPEYVLEAIGLTGGADPDVRLADWMDALHRAMRAVITWRTSPGFENYHGHDERPAPKLAIASVVFGTGADVQVALTDGSLLGGVKSCSVEQSWCDRRAEVSLVCVMSPAKKDAA